MTTAPPPPPAAATAAAVDPSQPAVSRRTLWLCVLPAMFVPGVGALCYFVFFAGTPLGKVIFVATKIFTFSWPLVAAVVIERHRFQPRSWFARRSLGSLPLGLVTGLAIGGAILGLFFWSPLGAFVWDFAPAVKAQTEAVGLYSWFIPFALLWSIGHSLLEEFYWRWYVFGRLDQLVPAPWAHGLAGLCFGFHHYVILTKYFPAWAVAVFGTGVAIGGVIWSLQYKRDGSLLGPWLSHIFADLAAILWIGWLLIFSTPPA